MTKELAIKILSTRDRYGCLCGWTSGYTEALDMAVEALQERPKGKWIDMNGAEVFPFWQRYKCSVCGERADMSNYCPRCGAEMRGEDDEWENKQI